MREDPNVVLQIKNVSKAFGGVQALENVHFRVRTGEVHGVMGENGAGKSTLMKSLMGLVQPDSGQIIFQGEPLDHTDVKSTLDRGISMVHQEIMPVPELTVAQNIFLGQEKTKTFPGWIDEEILIQKADRLLEELNVEIDVTRPMKQLSIAEMQMVEIAKALSNNAKVIIMDEPTSSLSSEEVRHLFSVIRKQEKRGVTVIYISHRMEEIFQICDRITVLRDGRHVGTKLAETLNEDQLIRMMVGRSLDTVFPEKNNKLREVIFSVKGFSKKGRYNDINFEVRHGEVLGLAGLIGAGRTDIVKAIMGLETHDKGTIELYGREVTIDSPQYAIRQGISYVTEDRKESGIIQDLSVCANLTLSNLRSFVSGMMINEKMEKKAATNMIERLSIKTPHMFQKVRFLSGGNQQKVIIGKSLLTEPEVLILDEPTRGIDVGAKFEIYQLIDKMARAGKAVILISSELSELLGLSHRILVLSKGELTAELPANEATQEMIMKYAIANR